MASKALASPGQDEAAAPPQTLTVPDLEAWRRMSAEVALFLQPEATGCRFIVDVPNAPETVYGIPFIAAGHGKERRVIEFLEKFPADEWVNGRTIAAEIELEYGGGQFGKLMSKLVNVKKLLESNRTQGYRLKRV